MTASILSHIGNKMDVTEQLQRVAKIESSPVLDTSCLAEIIYNLTIMQFLCWKCPKPVNFQFLKNIRLYETY